MKWRAFGRTPQWVRLSEWLGLAEVIDEFLKFCPHGVFVELDLNRIPRMIVQGLIQRCYEVVAICDIERKLSHIMANASIRFDARLRALQCSKSLVQRKHL